MELEIQLRQRRSRKTKAESFDSVWSKCCVCPDVCVVYVFLYVSVVYVCLVYFCMCISVSLCVYMCGCGCLHVSMCISVFYIWVYLCAGQCTGYYKQTTWYTWLNCCYATHHFVQCKLLIKKKTLKKRKWVIRRQSQPERLSCSHFEIGMKRELAREGGKGTYLKQCIASFTTCVPWSLGYPSVAHILVHVSKEFSCNMHQRVYSSKQTPTVACGKGWVSTKATHSLGGMIHPGLPCPQESLAAQERSVHQFLSLPMLDETRS